MTVLWRCLSGLLWAGLWAMPGVAVAQGGFGAPGFGGPTAEPITLSAQIVPHDGPTGLAIEVQGRLGPGKYTYAMSQPTGKGPFGVKITLDDSDQFTPEGEWTANREPKIEREPQFDNATVHKLTGTVTWTRPIRLTEGSDLAGLSINARANLLVCDAQSCIPVDDPRIVAKPSVAALEAWVERTTEDEVVVEGFRNPNGKFTWTARLVPGTVAPGGSTTLVVSATPDEEAPWHIFPLGVSPAASDPSMATIMALTELGPLQPQRPTLVEPEASTHSEGSLGEVAWHESPVTWRIRIDVPEDTPLGALPFAGRVGFQACLPSDAGGVCLTPTGIEFTGTLQVAEQAEAAPAVLRFEALPGGRGPGSYQAVEAALTGEANFNAGAEVVPYGPDPNDDDTEPTATAAVVAPVGGVELLGYLLMAAVGGFLLNFMPCVLPVVGLKVMSFVSQAGQSRTRVFLLNVYYTMGIIAVFLILATLAALPAWVMLLDSVGVLPEGWGSAEALGWGQLFQFHAFLIGLASLVWIMALSFLGVWEIPVPGFAVSDSMNRMASQEGFSGAFSKGIVATLLATPCTAPMIGPAAGFALTQPAAVVYGIFLAMALGFASPYLVIGLRPSLARYLPKPGAWMNTFKQVMGFFLVGTVAFLLFSLRQDGTLLYATVVFLLTLWFSCWYIDRIPVGAGKLVTLHGWLVALTVAGVVGLFVFGALRFQALLVLALGLIAPLVWIGLAPAGPARKTDQPVDWQAIVRRWASGLAVYGAVVAVALGGFNQRIVLPWQEQPFSRAFVAELVNQGNTVMVEFTADWCANCHIKEEYALYTPRVLNKVTQNNVKLVLADYTDFAPEIQRVLDEHQLSGIPLTIIYPAGRLDEPIVMPNIFTEGALLESLDLAGPSQATAATETIARRDE